MTKTQNHEIVVSRKLSELTYYDISRVCDFLDFIVLNGSENQSRAKMKELVTPVSETLSIMIYVSEDILPQVTVAQTQLFYVKV